MKIAIALLVFPLSLLAAELDFYPSNPCQEISSLSWGGIAGYRSPRDAWLESDLQDQLVELGMTSLRWPSGSRANAYNLWNHGMFFDEYLGSEGLNALRFIRVLRELKEKSGDELDATLVYRFGTGSATDAADFAEFFLAPSGVGLGVMRDDALIANGIEPGPISVRAFEIGNEIAGDWELEYSWTAEDSREYYFGGDHWRRPLGGDPLRDPLLPDFFGAWPSEDTDLLLRFPPLEPDSVSVYEVELDSQGMPISVTPWFETSDILSAPLGERFFEVKPDSTGILIGDGLSYGYQPEPGIKLVVDYKTINHDGAIAMANAMTDRLLSLGLDQVPVGFCYPLPASELDEQEMHELFSSFDFQIHHWYGRIQPTDDVGSENMAFICSLAEHKAKESWDFYQFQADSVQTALGYDPNWVITEWNATLNEQSNALYGPGAAAFTALYQGGVSSLENQEDFLGSWHFSTCHFGGYLMMFHYDPVTGHSALTMRGLGFKLAHQALSGHVMPVDVDCEMETPVIGGVPVDSLNLPRVLALSSVDEENLAFLLINSSEAVSEPCTLRMNGSQVDLTMDLYTPVSSDPASPLFLSTQSLGSSDEFFVTLPPRSLALFRGLRSSTSSPPSPGSLVFQTRDSPSASPRLFWSRAERGSLIRVYDLRGRRVATQRIEGESGTWLLPASFASGTYWACLKGETRRLVKLR
ncbi:MAG: hypothetical protein QGG80_05840 [Candidatus Krumholzibacteria bacterium]|nr:hypothetical protein [Candidatus Krumholzibacteria bacterium]MDP6796968.1 hypothetical protein [Candidatus Krumholzibacteria bacterium]MDP7021135.1 hypothetical protein [Candidatus Krumholzibacteria bacterium]